MSRNGAGAEEPHNAYNVAARRRRLEQCAEAVRLQADGLGRAQVAERLGVGADTVKLLLRDGMFFANPSGNPERARLAGLASAAQDRGLTRAQFEWESGLSGNAAALAWRDADALRSMGGGGTGAEG
jgi:DNA polymerase-3 subunit epsilon